MGTHSADSSDTLPVYVSWYEIVKEGNSRTIIDGTAGMDSGADGLIFTVKIENYGPEGTLVKGAFSGRLQSDDGVFHEVKDGRFAIERRNVRISG